MIVKVFLGLVLGLKLIVVYRDDIVLYCKYDFVLLLIVNKIILFFR